MINTVRAATLCGRYILSMLQKQLVKDYCPHCGGRGVNYEKEPCKTCRGSGSVVYTVDVPVGEPLKR